MLQLPSAAVHGLPYAGPSDNLHQPPLLEVRAAALADAVRLPVMGPPMSPQLRSGESATTPAAPEATTGLGRRIASGLSTALFGGMLISVSLYAVMPSDPLNSSDYGFTHCFPTPEESERMAAELHKPEVIERLRLIQELVTRELEIRAQLQQPQPGVITPRNQEQFR